MTIIPHKQPRIVRNRPFFYFGINNVSNLRNNGLIKEQKFIFMCVLSVRLDFSMSNTDEWLPAGLCSVEVLEWPLGGICRVCA